MRDPDTDAVVAPAQRRTAALDTPLGEGAKGHASTAVDARTNAGSRHTDPRLFPQRSTVGYYDREGRFLYATPSLAAYMGMTPDELIGRTWAEIGVPPEAVERLEAARRHVLDTGEPVSERVSFVIRGMHRATEFVIKPVIDRDGSHIGAVVTAWDASAHRPSASGRARLDRTYAILNAIDQVILRARDSSVILGEACRIAAGVGGFELAWVGIVDPSSGDVRIVAQAGRDEGLLGGLTITARDEPSGHGVVGTSIRENRTVVIQDVKGDPRMDSWRPFFDRLGYRTAAGFPLRVAGRTIGALVMYSAKSSHFDALEVRLYEQLARDISDAVTLIETDRDLAAAQEAVEASELRYRDLFDKIPQPLAVYDVKTLRFLAVNDAAESAYGYTRDEFATMTVAQVLPPEDLPALLEDVAEALRGRSGYRPTGTWRQVRKDGTVFFAEVSTRDMVLDGHSARLVLAIDVTDRRRLEAQLAKAARLEAMGHLAGGIAHDFNNLLTAVNGYADFLLAELGDDPRGAEAREIRRAGSRAAELTRQVLAFARKQAIDPRPVDLNAVVASVSRMLSRLIGEQIRLVTTCESAPAVVMADAGQLEQVLVNLAVNARDAMRDGGVLELCVKHVDDASVFDRGIAGPAALLTVADTGTGMDEGTLARIFEPFFTTKELGQGTGLGLATVYGIVAQSNGTVWAESQVGAGTTFSILFPLVDATAERPKVAPHEIRETAGASVLVVEDDPSVRAFVVGTLERAGHRVMSASSPAQARALSDGLDEPIDLLLTDLVMPGGNGRDLADRLLARRPSMRVILMSGYDETLDVARQDRFGFLPKPFGADELAAALETSLSSGPGEGQGDSA